MLTRTPEQIALAETSRLCQEIIDLCGDAREQSADARLRALMAKLIDEHRRVQAAVDERLRALDDLPLSPDPEWEGLKKLATRTKKIFASDDNAVLLDERIEDEKQLLSYVGGALGLDLTGPTRGCLEDVRRAAEAALHGLAEERKAHDA